MTRPSFQARSQVNKRLVTRIGRSTLGADLTHPEYPGAILSDNDFAAKQVVIADGSGKKFTTFLNGDYFHEDYVSGKNPLEVGKKVGCSRPAGDHDLTEQVMGVVVSVGPSLCSELLEQLIMSGVSPLMMANLRLTFDVRASLLTASEMEATIWNIPDPRDGNGIAFSEVPGHKVSKFTVESILRKVVAEAKTTEELKMLLPAGVMVSATATKSIVEWRNWILSASSSPESIWLRVQMYKWLDDAAHSLFVGCERVLETARLLESVFGDKG